MCGQYVEFALRLRIGDKEGLTMKIKIAKFKDIDNLFIEYRGRTISYRTKQEFVFKNNLGIQLQSEQEKEHFTAILRRFIKELERLEF